jgi:hypothetical protein
MGIVPARLCQGEPLKKINRTQAKLRPCEAPAALSVEVLILASGFPDLIRSTLALEGVVPGVEEAWSSRDPKSRARP